MSPAAAQCRSTPTPLRTARTTQTPCEIRNYAGVSGVIVTITLVDPMGVDPLA